MTKLEKVAKKVMKEDKKVDRKTAMLIAKDMIKFFR